jgi:hypothetical protein
MADLIGTMTCECGESFELHEGDSQSGFEERLSAHVLRHRYPESNPQRSGGALAASTQRERFRV